MGKKLKEMPVPLQRQILLRSLMGCAFLLLSIAFLIMGYDAVMVIPGFGFMLYCFINAYILYRTACEKRYVIVEGVCRDIRRSLVLRRPSGIILEAEGHILRIPLKQRMKTLKKGMRLEVYIRDKARVYDNDNMLLVTDYILIRSVSAETKVLKQKIIDDCKTP